jgi:hypothetical protein
MSNDAMNLKVIVGLFNATPGYSVYNQLKAVADSAPAGVDGSLYLAQQMATWPAFTNIVANMGNAEKVNYLLNTFNAHGNTNAINYFTQALAQGQDMGTIVYNAVSYLSGTTVAPDLIIAQQTLLNKLAASNEYSLVNKFQPETLDSMIRGISTITEKATTLSAMTTEDVTQLSKDITQLYISILNRAPDSNGLSYWVGEAKAGMTVADIAKSFFDQTETRTMYPNYLTDTDFVTKVYNNVLNRAPDSGGLKYWVERLDSGTITRDNFITSFTFAVNAETGTTDKALIDNKIAVGQYFAITKGLNDGTQAQSIMSKVVDGSAGELKTVTGLIDGLSSAGTVYQLTTNVDNLTGTSNNDTFIIDNTGTVKTSSLADKINGNGGVDTVQYYASSTDTTLTLPTLKDISILNVFGGNGIKADISQTNVQTVLFDMIGGDTKTILSTTQKFIMNNNNVTVKNIDLTYTDNTNMANISLNASGNTTTASNLTIGGPVTKITVESERMANNIVLKSAAADTLTDLVLTGTKDVSMVESITTLKNITATNLTGDLSIDMTAMAKNNTLTFAGSKGDNTLSFKAGHLDSSDHINFISGNTNKIVINDTVMTTDLLTSLNGATNLTDIGFATTGAVLDVSKLTNVNNIEVESGNISLTATNVGATTKTTIDLTTNNSGTISLSTAAGNNVQNIILKNNDTTSTTLTGLTVTGNSINLTTSGTGDINIDTLTNSDNTLFTLLGSNNLSMTVTGNTLGSTVNGTKYTGQLNITSSGKGDILKGGSAADTLISSGGNDDMYGAGGANIFDISASVYGVGKEFTTIEDIKATDTIILADKGVDKFVSTKTDVTAATSVSTALGIASSSEDGSKNGQIVWFNYAGDTYVLESQAANGAGLTAAAATDLVIKLTGTHDLSHSALTGNSLAIF